MNETVIKQHVQGTGTRHQGYTDYGLDDTFYYDVCFGFSV